MAEPAATSASSPLRAHALWTEEVAKLRDNAESLPQAARDAIRDVLVAILDESNPRSEVAASARSLLAAVDVESGAGYVPRIRGVEL